MGAVSCRSLDLLKKYVIANLAQSDNKASIVPIVLLFRVKSGGLAKEGSVPRRSGLEGLPSTCKASSRLASGRTTPVEQARGSGGTLSPLP